MIIYILEKAAAKVYSLKDSYEIFTGNIQQFTRDIIYTPLDMFVSNNVYLQFCWPAMYYMY